MDNKEYVIGIDIGSSNVVMAVGERNDNGEMSVLGVDVQEIDDCVKDGDIVNYIELGKAISRAKSALENELGRRINSAYVGISGRSVYCVHYEDYVEIDEKRGYVTDNEMRELHARMAMVMPGGGDDIVDRIPLRYTIDDSQEVKNPVGAFGRKLSATYLFVMAGKQQIDRVNKALYRAEIKLCGLCVNPTLLPRTLLSKDESEEGVVVVDLGSDLTDISIVRGGKLWYFSSLPIGASAINNDLHDFLRTSKREVETTKRKYGSAAADGVPDDATVPVKVLGHAKKQILQRNIAEIAEERLKDIAGFVARELKAAKSSTKVPCGVVLTGGSAYLSNLELVFARELQMEVRLGTMLNGLDDNSQQVVSAYPQAVAVGLLLYGAEHSACETVQDNNGVKNEQPAKPDEEEQQQVPPTIFTSPKEDKPVDTIPRGEETKNPNGEELDDEYYPPFEDEYPDGDNTDNADEADDADDVVVEDKDNNKSDKSDSNGNAGGSGGWASRFRDWIDDVFAGGNDYL